MKSVKRLLAVVFIIAIFISAFALPSYALTIYEDKHTSYGFYDEECIKRNPNPKMKVYSQFDYASWDSVPWRYKDGKQVNARGLTSMGAEYPTRQGVILVTSSALPSGAGIVGHAAIIWNATTIIESQWSEEYGDGVVLTPNNWNTAPHYKGDPAGSKEFVAVTPYNTTIIEDRDAAIYCYLQLGKPYNFNYLNYRNNRETFYCSQLVWAAYYDSFGIDLDRADYPVDAVAPYELVPVAGKESEFIPKVIYAQNWWGRPLMN